MKRLLICCLVFLITLNLASCGTKKVIKINDKNSKTNKNLDIVSQKDPDTSENENKKNYIKELKKIKNEEDLNKLIAELEYSDFEYNFEDGSKLIYKDNSIVLNKRDSTSEKINQTVLASKPYLSPDKKRFVFIDPNEADCPGDLYLYDINNEKLETLIQPKYPKGTNTPKKVRWIDDRYLLVVIGYGYGHHNLGGDLYVYDLQNNKISWIKVLNSPNSEVRTIEIFDSIIHITIFNLDNENIENIELSKDEIFSSIVEEGQ